MTSYRLRTRRENDNLDGVRTAAEAADAFDPNSLIESVALGEILDVVVTDDDEPVAFSTYRHWTEADDITVLVHGARIHPSHRNRGIGTELVKSADHFAAQIGATVVGANASSTQPDAAELLLNSGYNETFGIVEMEMELAGWQPQPSHVQIETAREADVSALNELNALAYAGRSFVSQPALPDLGPLDLCAIAKIDGTYAGFVSGAVRDDGLYGDINEVSISPQFRRRGLARGLLSEVLARLATRNVQFVRLSTDRDDISGARSLYDSLGFVAVKTFQRFRKSVG